MILTMVALLSMTTAFAEGENAANVENMEASELNINMNEALQGSEPGRRPRRRQ